MQVFVEDEFAVGCRPAGERAGRFFDVGFGVVAFAEAEQFQQFAAVVFVGAAFDVAVRVEPDQHRGVAADVVQQGAELAQGVFPQQSVLLEHQLVADDLSDAGGEVIVPEQGAALFQRVRRVEHPVQPPALQFFRLRAGELIRCVARAGDTGTDVVGQAVEVFLARAAGEQLIDRPGFPQIIERLIKE